MVATELVRNWLQHLRFTCVTVKQEGKKPERSVDEVIIAIGLVRNNEVFKNLGLKTDKHGFILTDAAQRTNIEGIFTVGDITYIGLRLITVPAAHEAIASHHIHSYLKKPTEQEKLGLSRFSANIR